MLSSTCTQCSSHDDLVKKILILTANPKDTTQLRLDEEVREIQEGLQRSRRRDQFEIISRWAVRTDDLRRALLDHEPQIVHFLGHGAGAKGLILEDDVGQMKLVSASSLARLFKLFQSQVECVVLNACYSEVQAEAIQQHIDCVIGMNQAIGDRAAIEFAVGFYDGLGAGRSYADAFEFGLSAIDLEGIPETATPQLKQRSAATPQITSIPRSNIFLSYKRNTAPDEPVALDIYAALRTQHRVFIDQEMSLGTDWVEQIKQEIFQADVLIVLLSAQAVQSEMLEQEIKLAAQSAEQRGGLPLIFPVRLAYTTPFPYPFNHYLDPLQWATWATPADTPRLIAELQASLAGSPLPIDTEAKKRNLLQAAGPDPSSPAPLAQPPSNQVPEAIDLDPPEGTIDVESSFYIQRADDQLALVAVRRRGCTFSILGPRQMGKSSLLIRAMAEARKLQKRVVYLDFQPTEAVALKDAVVFYRRFCELITLRLRLVSQVERWWEQYSGVGNPDRCTNYVRDYLLAEVESPVFLAMDEVDKLIASPFRDEFFAMLRSWHNERAFEPSWKRLDLALVTCTEPYQLIQDLNQSPFNVGTPIQLKDFHPQEVAELNRRHGQVLHPAELRALMDWVGGHPYLVRKALYLAASGEMTIAEVFKTAKTDRGPFSGHLRYHFFRMADKPHLVQGMLQVIRNQTCADEQVLRRLESAGLVQRSASGRQVLPRCRLYAEYFKEHLHE